MDFSFLHEVESVEFRPDSKRPVTELGPILKSCGFTIHDDVASLDRRGKTPPWQHSSIVEVEVQCDGQEVFGFDDGNWDVLALKYLFAYLPFELSSHFVIAVSRVSERLGIPPARDGDIVTLSDIEASFTHFREEVLRETGEDVGSEGLAIFIHGTYPRRRASSRR